MDEVIDLVQKMKCAHAFIYKIKNNYYYISSTIFRECTKEEVENYELMMAEFQRLQKLRVLFDLEPKDCCAFQPLFQKIISIDDIYDERLCLEISQKICSFLTGLSKRDLEDFIQQRNDLQIMYRLGSGNTYSYAKL